jgi:hypothetical protein
MNCGESLQFQLDSELHGGFPAQLFVLENREGNAAYGAEFDNGCQAYPSPADSLSSAELVSDSCTITFTRPAQAGQLTVSLVCVPSDDPGAFVILLEGFTDLPLDCPGAGRLPASITLPVSPQSHVVAELGRGADYIDEYDVRFDGDCTPGDFETYMLPNGLVTITPGGQFHCIITNVRKR